MLILSRNPQETIVIGGQIRVTVLSVKGSQVRIGIDAPRTIEVHREEIYERIERERIETKEEGDDSCLPTFSRDTGG